MDAAEIARLREINEAATQRDWVSADDAKLKAALYPQDVAYVVAFSPTVTRALLDAADALEQARKERNNFRVQLDAELNKESRRKGILTKSNNDRIIAEIERDAAQKDAKDARALLARAKHSISELFILKLIASPRRKLQP